jgi:hypothetical protein
MFFIMIWNNSNNVFLFEKTLRVSALKCLKCNNRRHPRPLGERKEFQNKARVSEILGEG